MAASPVPMGPQAKAMLRKTGASDPRPLRVGAISDIQSPDLGICLEPTRDFPRVAIGPALAPRPGMSHEETISLDATHASNLLGNRTSRQVSSSQSFSAAGERKPTLRVRDLLGTRLNLIRIELSGANTVGVARFGRLAVYGPFFLVGYLLILAAVARLMALKLGWGGSLLLLGGLHVGVGLIGVATGPDPTRTTRFPIVDPDLSSDETVERKDTLVTGQAPTHAGPPTFPPRTRTSP